MMNLMVFSRVLVWEFSTMFWYHFLVLKIVLNCLEKLKVCWLEGGFVRGWFFVISLWILYQESHWSTILYEDLYEHILDFPYQKKKKKKTRTNLRNYESIVMGKGTSSEVIIFCCHRNVNPNTSTFVYCLYCVLQSKPSIRVVFPIIWLMLTWLKLIKSWF